MATYSCAYSCGGCLSVGGWRYGFYTYMDSEHHAEPVSNVAASNSNHNVEMGTSASYNEMADYTMLDNDDIYSLLASN